MLTKAAQIKTKRCPLALQLSHSLTSKCFQTGNLPNVLHNVLSDMCLAPTQMKLALSPEEIFHFSSCKAQIELRVSSPFPPICCIYFRLLLPPLMKSNEYM